MIKVKYDGVGGGVTADYVLPLHDHSDECKIDFAT